MPRTFHGGAPTTAPLNPGRVQPQDAADWCYLTTDLDLAWVYAWHAPGRGHPRVVEVEPFDLDPDPEHSAGMDAWRCRWARVITVHRTPTVTESEARSGWVLEVS